MSKKQKKPKVLKATVQEAAALLDYLVSEAYFAKKDMGYRLRVPYYKIDETDKKTPSAEMVVEIKVYYDGELYDERNSEVKYKITGATKGRH